MSEFPDNGVSLMKAYVALLDAIVATHEQVGCDCSDPDDAANLYASPSEEWYQKYEETVAKAAKKEDTPDRLMDELDKSQKMGQFPQVVYVVTSSIPYEGSEIRGVFATRELANLAVEFSDSVLVVTELKVWNLHEL